ncbi:abortive infection system antitoxin AbiGi family protein [Vibrio pacinii]|uniref:abortive infection system antitoxin AbiGi family protein n=1 Tax=Vibrio pacinii TaxID=170674 RepID=UPI00068F64EC|nr:abortive infection system antitoxin AbiGi family protein [Vibrio pacinii]
MKIIQVGFWPRYCLEDFRWYNPQLENVAYPMVCFCDIPLTRIIEHTSFYGRFGIGMKREWAIQSGLNPVMYLTEQSPLKGKVLNLARLSQPGEPKFVDESAKATHIDSLLNLISMIKPLDGYMEIGSPPYLTAKDFYLENEWRFVPRLSEGRICIPSQKFRSERDEYNSYTYENCLLKFTLDDIEYIFVEDDRAIQSILDFLNSMAASGKYLPSQMDVLKTKLFTLSKLSRDF